MGWMYAWSRRSGQLLPVAEDDEPFPLNGFACVAVIQAFAIFCPACGAPYEISVRDKRPSIFDRRTQRFRCGRCRFSRRLRLTADCGFAPEQPDDPRRIGRPTQDR